MRRLSLLLTIVAALALVACGGGGGKPLTLDEYIRRVVSLDKEHETRAHRR